MISIHYPRPEFPSSAWFKNQIGAYDEYSDIYLCVPVHITPSIKIIKQKNGIIEKIRSIKDQLLNVLSEDLPSFSTPVKGEYVRFASIPPQNVFPYSGGIILTCRLLLILIGRKKFDIIHGQGMIHDGLAAVMLGWLFKCPSVVTAIGSDIHAINKGTITYKTTLFVLKRATLITTVSGELKQRIVDMGIDERKIKVVPNGVDPDFNKKAQSIDIRRRTNIPGDAKVFGFVGRLIPVKDPVTLLCAFRTVMQNREKTYLMFVGDGELKSGLMKMADAFGIGQSVRFSDGMVQPGEIPSYMQAFDYLCLSSTGEGWPNVILEAMICGKPVIGTRVGGVPEAIASEEYGLLVPPGDPAAMAQAMIRALNVQWDRQKISDYARENSWNNVGKRYGDIYKELCSSSN